MAATRRRVKTKAATRGERVERTFMFTDLVKSTDVRSAVIARVGEYQGNQRFRVENLLPHNRVMGEHGTGHRGEMIGMAGDSCVPRGLTGPVTASRW